MRTARKRVSPKVMALAGLSTVAIPGLAQEAELAEVTITGSRIRSENNESPVPVLSIGADQITATGNVALGDLLNEMPALRPTFSQANSTRFIGTAGLNTLDLRGLGGERTLVLQNGRRHVSADAGSHDVDVNTIPTDLVERIDIVTGGASAVYGSDAVGGVVNFILMNDFEGLKVRLQPGLSEQGDRNSYLVAVTGGMNFMENRGNVALSAEFSRQDTLNVTARPDQTGAFTGRGQFQLTENPAGETGGSDGTPDRSFETNVRSAGLSEGGTFIASSGAASALGACATTAGCIDGRPRIYRFQPDGSLREADYGLDLRPQTNNGTGNSIDGDGSTLRRYGQLQPHVMRYGVNLLSHLDVAAALTPYIEGKYVRYDIEQESSPTFAQGGTQTGTPAAQTAFTGANSTGIPIRLDNPFLSPQAAALVASVMPAGQVAFRLQRNHIDIGTRAEEGYRETSRVVLGLRGGFNDDWGYDVSLNYGRFSRSLTSIDNRIQQRFRLAVDAAPNAAGQIVCRSQLPGQITPPPANPADAAALAEDIAACVPLNLFGEGAPTQAALDYVNVDTSSILRQEQRVALAYVTGDSSQLFELQGGPVAFVVGGEWRRENGFRDYGDLVTQNRTFLTAISRFQPPADFEVREVFTELEAPLLADMRFAQELSVKGAARYADYEGSVGGVLAWSGGASWAPIRDVRFRTNYAVAVRAPTQFDLYAELGQNFAQLNDPCDVNNISNGTATRAANCAAAGIPAGFINSPARGATTAYSNGGNALLQEEESTSWTIGVVLQPSFVPGLTATIDYYDIEIEDVIDAPTAQQILNACYDAATLNNPFCTVINREPGTNFFSTTAPEFGLVQGGINYAKSTAQGFDGEIAYVRDLGLGRLTARLNGTLVEERNDYPFIDEPERPDQLLLEVGDPEVRASLSTNLQVDAWNFGYQGRYFSKQAVASITLGGGIEDIRAVGGRPPQNSDFATREFLPSQVYHDLRVGFDFSDQVELYAGVDNLFDELPPYGLLANGSIYAADAIFDNIGRFYYAGAVMHFGGR